MWLGRMLICNFLSMRLQMVLPQRLWKALLPGSQRAYDQDWRQLRLLNSSMRRLCTRFLEGNCQMLINSDRSDNLNRPRWDDLLAHLDCIGQRRKCRPPRLMSKLMNRLSVNYTKSSTIKYDIIFNRYNLKSPRGFGVLGFWGFGFRV